MENCEILAWYGAAVMALSAGFILVPYLRGKADLISAWNFLLGGIAIFVGIGCFEASTTPMRFPGLQWFEPTKSEVNRYLATTTVFLVALFLAYYYDPVSKALAKRSLNKWPPDSSAAMLFVIVICFSLVMMYMSPTLLNVTFIGPLLVNVSHKALVFACVFSFALWYRNKINLIWLALFIAVFISMCLISMLAGHGRRILLSVLITPVLVVYFYSARNWRPTRGMVAMAVGLFALFNLNLMYSSIRHFDWQSKQERTAAGLIKEIRNVGKAGWFERFANDSLFHFSQQVVHYGLLTDRYVRTGQLQAQPLNTFKFIAVYPIPRRIWEDKPEVLAIIIVRDVVHAATNWGTGVAGQAAYEGGIIVAAMFGYMAAFGVRFFDDPLRRQPTNPYLIGMLSAAAPHILAWPRGDLSNMTLEAAECFFFAIAMSIAGRMIFGTQRVALPSAGSTLRLAYPRLAGRP